MGQISYKNVTPAMNGFSLEIISLNKNVCDYPRRIEYDGIDAAVSILCQEGWDAAIGCSKSLTMPKM